MKITFPDNSKKEFEQNSTGLDIANSISEGLGRAAIAVKVNNKLQDLTTPITEDSTIQIITFKDDEGKQIFWHSSSHLLAHAVTELYPEALPTIGPSIDNGFYYDFDANPFTDEDLKKIEQKMKEISKEKLEITRHELDIDEALEHFSDNKYKVELIKGLKEKGETKVTYYKEGDFEDLCRGPHVPNTGKIKAFKLMKVSGSYWRGNAENDVLQRIYGISYPDKKELKEYLRILEEAKKRDHRILGKKLNLFSFQEEAPGMPFFHNKGTFIFLTLQDFMRTEMRKLNYEENKTPIILNRILWEKSGHWGHYKENMYFTRIDEEDFAVKPMNCPGNLLIYKNKAHSYKELPIKAGEFGLVHRHELSGVLSGLFRVRSFTQDDAHVFCLPEQVEDQIIEIINLIEKVYSTFGFNYEVELSTRPAKAMGSDEMWNKAESALKAAIEKAKIPYKLNPGDGAFYGPKIDFHIKDAIGRTWQCGTIQLDFQMPEKFDLTYQGSDGEKHRPVMLHRAIYGSIERFIGILIEHFAGKFPLWLNPVQVKVLPITDRNVEYSKTVVRQLKEQNIRVELDDRAETTNKKIRDAQLEFVNYILVIGDKEQENKTINVRTRDNEVRGEMSLDDLSKEIKDLVNKKQ